MQKPLILIAILLLTLAGCAGQQLRTSDGTESAEAITAAQAMENQDYPLAIQLYTGLADNSPVPQQYEYRYLAAVAMFRAGLAQQANQTVEQLPTERLPLALLFKRQLLMAEIVLKRDPEMALNLLLKPAVNDSLLQDNDDLFARYHQLRARAFSRLGNHLEAARSYVIREFYLTEPQQIEANQMAIWQTLSLLTPQALEQLRTQPPPDALSGWMELVAISKDYTLTPDQVLQKIDLWRNRYISHPASEQVLTMLYERSRDLNSRPAHIAMLLPLSGRYAKVGAAIQDGILAAYYSDPMRHDITLLSYDTASQGENVSQLYNRAVADGADFIIGPLDKGAVAALATQESLPLSTLALNYAQDALNDRLYQFSLAPEDEAREVAERAWQTGYTQAAILMPNDALGKRLNLAFSERWRELGGKVVSESSYQTKSNDFATPIKALLNISDSERRERRVRQLLGERVEYLPRRRQDIDFVFLAATPLQARQIRPQMKFQHAGDLPLLATSDVYSGKSNRTKDNDMNDILFCDMPWTLNADSTRQELKRLHEEEFKPYAGQLQRFVAMGIDAYQLVPLLSVLQGHPYEQYRGETGNLRVTPGRRIGRSLRWARFDKGLATLEKESVTDDEADWQNKR